MTEDKFIDKIRAILRKAEESQNPHEEERDTAMRMANRLLLKHGLTMQDVGDLEDPTDREFTEDAYMEYEQEQSWMANLLNSISPIYFCKCYRLPLSGGRNRLMLIGRRENVATCQAMFEFVHPQLQREFNLLAGQMDPEARMARKYAMFACLNTGRANEIPDMTPDELGDAGIEYWTQQKEEFGAAEALVQLMLACGITSAGTARNVRAYVTKGRVAPDMTENLGVYRRSFFHGAVIKVTNRLREMMKEEVDDLGSSGTALVKNEMADLDRFMQDLGLHLRGQRRTTRRDRAGMNAGVKAGERADLSGHRKMTGNRKELGHG